MKLALPFSFIIFLSILSCNNRFNNNPGSVPIDTIDLSKSLNKFDLVTLSGIASKIEYIKLQSDSTCYINRLAQPLDKYVKFFDGKLYVSDRLNILSFSKDGKFLTKYGSVGRGPGEYMQITDFIVCPKEDQLAILCAGCKKIYFYNLTGIFLKEVNVDFFPTRMIPFNDKLVLINSRQFRNLSDYYTVSILSKNGDIQKCLIKHENEVGEEERFSMGSDKLYILDNSLNYYEPIYDTIWRISPDFKLISKSIFYYSKDKLPFNDFSRSQSELLSKLKTHVFLNWYSETEKYMFFEIGNKGKRNNILLDKLSGRSFNLPFNKELGDISITSFYNDLDGGPPFWPSGVIANDRVFSFIQISSLKKYYDANKTQLDRLEYFHNDKLQEILEKSAINDNPIIMIVTLKDLDIK